ncbi:MAG: glutamate 5-kinase, partial [Desulfovibrio sp.]|nr:glutamate 5-kinase [Desulfovibrio sp.]
MAEADESERERALRGAKIIVVKIGSAVIAGRDSLNYQAMEDLAAQLAALKNNGKKIILVSSGAVAAGKAVLKIRGIDNFPNYKVAKRALAAAGQSLLMQAWNNAFAPWGVIVAQALLTRDDLRSRRRFQFATSTFLQMLAWDLLPIVNENGPVSPSEL